MVSASAQETALTPSVAAEREAAPAGQRRVVRSARFAAQVGLRAAYVIIALAMFVLALQTLKAAASDLKPVLDGLSADGLPGLLGFGWLGSYVVLSGSPVAAIALSLYSGGAISDVETFAMLNGSRLGASFIVLFVGFLYYLRGRRNPDGLYIGVVALLVAITLWAPVVPLGVLALRQGWFDGLSVGSPGAVTSVIDVVYDPVVDRVNDLLAGYLVFALGIGLLMAAFALFDRVLPNLEQPGPGFERSAALFHRPLSMFALGFMVTLMTMSVSLSLTILVPLTLKGYVRRTHIIPYVMGANIATWGDTLLAALLLDNSRAVTIVLTQVIIGAGISLAVLLVAYEPYRRAILWAAHRATLTRTGFATFLGAVTLLPALLFLV